MRVRIIIGITLEFTYEVRLAVKINIEKKTYPEVEMNPKYI